METMNIFLNKHNQKEYTLAVLKRPYPFLDGDSRLGVYAYPYNWGDDVIDYTLEQHEDWDRHDRTDISELKKLMLRNYQSTNPVAP